MDEKEREARRRRLEQLAIELRSAETQKRIDAQVRRNIDPAAREHARFLIRSRAVAHLRIVG